MKEPIWNVKVSVIDLVPAASGQEAIAKLAERIHKAGLDTYDEDDNAFMSEVLSDQTEEEVRLAWLV